MSEQQAAQRRKLTHDYALRKCPGPGLEFTTDLPEYDVGSLVSAEAMSVDDAQAIANMDADVLRDDVRLDVEASATHGGRSSQPIGQHGKGRREERQVINSKRYRKMRRHGATIPDSEVPRGTMEDEGDDDR